MTSTAMSSTLLSLTRPPIKSTVNVNINNNNTEAFSRRGLTLIRTTTTTPSSTNNNAPLILHKNSVAIAPASTYTTDSIGSAFKLPEDKQPVLVTSQSLSTSTDPKVGVSSCSVSHSLLMEVQQSKVPEVSKNNDNATPVIRFISTPEGNQVRFPSDVVLKEKFPPRCIKRYVIFMIFK
ncbi:unnamed protein product [Orchesella dallaii]|uniref:Uncharacterized protein n=1 Tax=Orchesella dallaii TaxID=48710 RepID=A0ABP1PWT0_9HEXA